MEHGSSQEKVVSSGERRERGDMDSTGSMDSGDERRRGGGGTRMQQVTL